MQVKYKALKKQLTWIKKEHDTLSNKHGALEKKYDIGLNEKKLCMKELEYIKIENEDLKKKMSTLISCLRNSE